GSRACTRGGSPSTGPLRTSRGTICAGSTRRSRAAPPHEALTAMQYARRAWIVLWKDLLTERRSKESLNALLFFSLLLLLLFEFALGPDRERLRGALPGLLWLGFVLAGLLGLGKTFMVERDNDCWEGLRLTQGDKSAIYVGKLLGSVVTMGVVEVFVLALFGLFYDVDLRPSLLPLSAVLALGTLGLAAVGTLFAAITAQVRARELLFP